MAAKWTEAEIALLRREAAALRPELPLDLARRLAPRLGRSVASVRSALTQYRVWLFYRHRRDLPRKAKK